MALPDPELEVRWLVHTAAGPLVVRVQTRDGRYVATLYGPPQELRTVGHVIAATADEAVKLIVEAVDGSSVIPLPPTERHKL